MGHFSVEIMRLPGQLSAEINTFGTICMMPAMISPIPQRQMAARPASFSRETVALQRSPGWKCKRDCRSGQCIRRCVA